MKHDFRLTSKNPENLPKFVEIGEPNYQNLLYGKGSSRRTYPMRD
jgi:hypothetical protein